MRALLGLIFGLSVSLILVSFAGESPLHVLEVLAKGTFGTAYDFGLTLFYATSLVFTGLSVCIAFHAGLFNIGAEGQLNIGAFVMAATGILLPNLPPQLAPFIAISMGITAAAIWGLIPGYLKARRGSHEVIVTMMMNFIAAGIISYLVVEVLQNPNSQNPETAELPSSFLFLTDFSKTPLYPLSFFAIGLTFCTWFFLYRTVWGFELRAVGQNEKAAEIAGISSVKYKIVALTLAGAFAGLVGVNEVLVSAGKFRLGFSADFGFVGIAVALLARNRPVAILLSAFLFAVLQKGASELDMETMRITRDFAKIMQAVIILSVAGFAVFDLQKIKKFANRS